MDKNITYLFIEPTELESGFAKTVAVYDQINRFWRFKTDAQSVREVEMGQVQGAKIVEMGIEDYKEDLRDRAEQRRLNRRGSDQNRVPRVPGAPKEPRVKRADREPKEPRAPKKEVVISDVADVSALMEELKINPLKYGKLDENLQQQVLARDPNIEIAFKQKEMESGRRQAFEKLQGSKIGSMFLEKFKMFQELAYLRSKDLTGKREGETQWSGPVSPDQPMTKEGFAAGKSQLDGVKAEVNRIKVSVAASEENKDDTEAINKKVNEKIAQLDKERQSKIESLTKRLTAAQQHVKIDMRHWRLMRPDPGYDPDKKDDGLDPEKRGKTGWEDVDDEPNEALRKRAIRRHQTRPHPEELFKNLSPDEMIHQKLTFIGVEANARRVAMEELGRRHKLGKAIRNKDTTATHKVFGTQIKTFPGRVEARVAHTLAGMATVYPEETHVDNQQIVRLEDDRFMGPTLKARATMAMRYNLLMGGNVSYTGKGLEDVRVLQPVLPMDEAGRSMAFEGGLTAAGGFTQAVADHGGFTEMGGGMSVVDDMMGGGGGMTVHGMDVDQGDSDEDEDAKARNEKFALY
ncbi:unnamed protein product [Amoebophrya sp. A120]|nr:unnamed protein product [Amoebophrya sp. A120]|eukprot:GSA120T00012735001.1